MMEVQNESRLTSCPSFSECSCNTLGVKANDTCWIKILLNAHYQGRSDHWVKFLNAVAERAIYQGRFQTFSGAPPKKNSNVFAETMWTDRSASFPPWCFGHRRFALLWSFCKSSCSTTALLSHLLSFPWSFIPSSFCPRLFAGISCSATSNGLWGYRGEEKIEKQRGRSSTFNVRGCASCVWAAGVKSTNGLHFGCHSPPGENGSASVYSCKTQKCNKTLQMSQTRKVSGNTTQSSFTSSTCYDIYCHICNSRLKLWVLTYYKYFGGIFGYNIDWSKFSRFLSPEIQTRRRLAMRM